MLRLFARDEAGAGMLEFAIAAGLVFIPVVFGIIEFGRLTWSKTMITAAAREGARFAIVRGSQSGIAADSAAVANYVIGITKLSPIVVKPSWTGGKNPGDTVTVQVNYTYTPIMPVISAKNITSQSRQLIAF